MNELSQQNFQIEVADQQSLSFDHQRLIDAVELILQREGYRESEISIALVDDAVIREYNRLYLDHDYETDVISFALDHDLPHRALTGQLIVSTETAARVAGELGVPTADELLLYVVHGTLHLVGLDDKSPEDAARMRRAEQQIFDCLKIPCPGRESETRTPDQDEDRP